MLNFLYRAVLWVLVILALLAWEGYGLARGMADTASLLPFVPLSWIVLAWPIAGLVSFIHVGIATYERIKDYNPFAKWFSSNSAIARVMATSPVAPVASTVALRRGMTRGGRNGLGHRLDGMIDE